MEDESRRPCLLFCPDDLVDSFFLPPRCPSRGASRTVGSPPIANSAFEGPTIRVQRGQHASNLSCATSPTTNRHDAFVFAHGEIARTTARRWTKQCCFDYASCSNGGSSNIFYRYAAVSLLASSRHQSQRQIEERMNSENSDD